MPSISAFYGIIVYMYFLDNGQHKLPHIHVKYSADKVIVSIPYGDVLEGERYHPVIRSSARKNTLSIQQIQVVKRWLFYREISSQI